MSFDPGRLPWRPDGLMEEAHRRERELEAKAELHAQLHSEDEERIDSVRGVRRALHRLRDAIWRRG